MAAKPVPDDTDLENARQLLLVAQGHPEFAGGELLAGDDGWRVRLDIKVEMPLHVKDDGVSETGVNTVETVFFEFPLGYPWRSPRVTLRKDFPRNFPHLLPGSSTNAPRPCLVDGNQDEFFLQFGLVEYGIYHVINQAAVWLRKAAIGDLIDPAQGWEPMMRRDFDDIIAIDAEAARSAVTKAGGFVVWGARYFRRGEFDSRQTRGLKLGFPATERRHRLGIAQTTSNSLHLPKRGAKAPETPSSGLYGRTNSPTASRMSAIYIGLKTLKP
jgi:hypothetical protein